MDAHRDGAGGHAGHIANFGRAQIFEIKQHDLPVGWREPMDRYQQLLDDPPLGGIMFEIAAVGDYLDLVEPGKAFTLQALARDQMTDRDIVPDAINPAFFSEHWPSK